jgi:hypothetical protein
MKISKFRDNEALPMLKEKFSRPNGNIKISKSFNQWYHHHHHWRDSPLWALAFLIIARHSSPFNATLLQFFTPKINQWYINIITDILDILYRLVFIYLYLKNLSNIFYAFNGNF